MKSKPNSGIEQLKAFIREPFAWPGGYPKYAFMGDGEALCRHCATKEFKRIISDTMQGYDNSFQVAGVDINWEDPYLMCCHCGNPIESAYGESL